MFDAAGAVVISLSARVPTHSVSEEVSPSKFEPTPAVKQPAAVVRTVSQDTAVRVFQNPYWPMVVRAAPGPGPFYPLRFSPYKLIHRTISGNYAVGGCRVVVLYPST